jgi:hypothetical protein
VRYACDSGERGLVRGADRQERGVVIRLLSARADGVRPFRRLARCRQPPFARSTGCGDPSAGIIPGRSNEILQPLLDSE